MKSQLSAEMALHKDKVENNIKSDTRIAFVFAFLKILVGESTGCRRFGDTAEKKELINLTRTILTRPLKNAKETY